MLFVLGCYSTFHFCLFAACASAGHPAPTELAGFFKKKQISNYIPFSSIILCSHNNIAVISYSRLTAGQSVADCLNKCRANQECYSFNYNKVTKWCYLGTTEEVMLRQTRNSKYASGVRRCVEHVGNAPWTNDEFTGGSEGTAPTAPAIALAVSTALNSVQVTLTAPSTFGTTAEGAASTVGLYRVTCYPTSGNSAYPTVVKTNLVPAAAADFGGLASGVAYSCAVVVTNAQGLESVSVTASASVIAKA